MNTNAINNCETGKEAPIYTRAIIQFIYMLYLCAYYIMIYSCILMVNAKRTEEIEKIEDDSDVIGFLKPEEMVDVAGLEEILGLINPKEVISSNQVEDEVEEQAEETLQIYDFEGTGEQLRRLRAYNPKNDGETDEDYTSRIWTMAYQEDEEEAKQKVVNEVVAENAVVNLVPVANEVAVANEVIEPLENDANTWYKFADGKCRYKGEWKNGLSNGKGIKHFYKTDSYIDGNFVDGFAEGYGKQTFEQTWEKTQPYYEGEFKRNNYNGKGVYYYGDGDYYKGDWKDGKYHGQGAAYSKRLNRTWVGEYKNDEKVDGNWVRGEI